MLELRNVTKDYPVGDGIVHALRGVSLCFRRNEFVSILGQSGCGKTTLLNIIGGLDRYTKGDLLINGRSTKDFRDRDWDSYRNHSVGFVFQSYHLIPHQTVLQNVEIALSLSGVKKKERRQRAVEALRAVGLGDQLNKRPAEMSGGQMQRVAIARAIVNDPDIILADEPTGALDSETSVQVMEILKKIAENRLVIMVTHNPELAEAYSTRTVRMLDGVILSDSNPLTEEEYRIEAENAKLRTEKARNEKKPSLSFATSFGLSLRNLFTKKGRTALTSFAGSIGIIGIALILSVSQGTTAYIDYVQKTTLSSYPLTIQKQTQDYTAMMGAMIQVQESLSKDRDPNLIYVDDSLGTMMAAMSATRSNNLEAFKAYIDEHMGEIEPYLSAIQYTYDLDLRVFTEDGKTQVSPTTIFDNMGSAFSGMTELMAASGMNGMSVMSEMIDNRALLEEQYEVIAGEWPDAADEVVLVVSGDNQISKMTLYMLGVLDQGELEDIMKDLMTDGSYDTTPLDPYTFDDFLGMTFRLLNVSDFYRKHDTMTYTVGDKTYPVWQDVRKDLLGYDQENFVAEHGTELKIAGILRPIKGAGGGISTSLAYTKALTDSILAQNSICEIVNQQKETPEYNVLTGLKFERTVYTKETIHKLIETIDDATMESLYAYMTATVKEQFISEPPVNAESFLGFAAIMTGDELSSLMDAMLQTVATVDPSGMMLEGLCASLSTDVLAVTPQNLLTVLPILTVEQRMTAVAGLSAICGPEAMASVYSYMNEQLLSMTVNDTNFAQLLMMMDDELFGQLQDMLYELAPQTDATLESNLLLLGDAEAAKPASINFYAVDFESKDRIEDFIEEYNSAAEENDKLKYTDMVGMLMSSVTTIID
ncbi:MAG: ABC transporter ATP-binding protein, partial [Clostridia bacterium]|nr:ABC transporter ATP-binding protein [Clostridia bacterium]